MSKKINPKIRRKKAAELLEQARQEEAKRFKELGELFSKTYLSGKPKPVSLEDFKDQAAKIFQRSSKKSPSPSRLKDMATDMVKEAEQEEAQRKQLIGEQVLDLIAKMPEPKPGTAADPQKLAQITTENLKQIKAVTEQIWQE